MFRFLVDEDLPRSTSRLLRDSGYEVFDVRDCGLRGNSDQELYQFALQNQASIITADLNFANIINFRLGHHFGIFVVHFPNDFPNDPLNHLIVTVLASLEKTDLIGNLIMFSPGRIRIRRK